LGANLSEFVGPNKTTIGVLLKDNICIIPLSIDTEKLSLCPKQVTKAGEDKSLSCSGNIASGIKP